MILARRVLGLFSGGLGDTPAVAGGRHLMDVFFDLGSSRSASRVPCSRPLQLFSPSALLESQPSPSLDISILDSSTDTTCNAVLTGCQCGNFVLGL
jgi:hypothetical protein